MKIKIFLWTFIASVCVLLYPSFESNAAERIHFIPVGAGDAILLESNGHFALIDGGEDQINFGPNGNLNTLSDPMYEKTVKNYLKSKITNTYRSSGGQTIYVLDFVVATHAHSDHTGIQRLIAEDSSFEIQGAYMKDYGNNYGISYFDTAYAPNTEGYIWDNRYQYKYLVQAFERAGVPIKNSQADLSKTINLGNMRIKFYNTTLHNYRGATNENEQSLAATVTYNGTTALLTADLDNAHGQVDNLIASLKSEKVKVDILKLIHHGDGGTDYIQKLVNNGNNNMIAVLTGEWKYATKPTQEILDNNGIVTYATGQKTDNGLTGDSYQPDWRGKNQGVIVDLANSSNRVPNNDPVYQRRNVNGNWYYVQMKTGQVFKSTNAEGTWIIPYREPRIRGDVESQRELRVLWFLVDKNGNMVTDWQEVNGKWYYFKRNGPGVSDGFLRGRDTEANRGEMLRGWYYETRWESWFYLYDGDEDSRRLEPQKPASEGEMLTGWCYDKVVKAWVYFKQNSINIDDHGDQNSKNLVKGAQYINGTYTIDGKRYTFNADGYTPR